jgi:hypothetical protein
MAFTIKDHMRRGQPTPPSRQEQSPPKQPDDTSDSLEDLLQDVEAPFESIHDLLPDPAPAGPQISFTPPELPNCLSEVQCHYFLQEAQHRCYECVPRSGMA